MENNKTIPETRNVQIKEAFDYLAQNPGRLSDSQLRFVSGLLKYYKRNKTLLERQTSALFEIRKYFE